ncbi:MAG: radical SAM protein, partial [Bacteroidia bacterium]|nr:radical SAM protein [Bacteroidia bacterium]
SGGEPTLQNNFLVELLKGAHQEGFNTAIETSGFCKWENIESILNIVDHFLFDVKHVSDEKHKMFTGVSNKIVLENLLRLIHKGVNVIVRVPLIPSFNCDEDDLRKIMSFLSEFLKKGSQIHLLPYHRFGLPKYDHIGDDNKMVLFEKINKSHIERATQIVNEFNFIANIGGS